MHNSKTYQKGKIMKLTKQILNTIKYANNVFYEWGEENLSSFKEVKMETHIIKECEKDLQDSLRLSKWIKHIETNRGYNE